MKNHCTQVMIERLIVTQREKAPNAGIAAYYLTCLYLGDYYRTYPEKDIGNKKITMEDELKSYLKTPTDFIQGPRPLTAKRDSPTNLSAGFVVCDSNYLSARWPGDAHRFATEFVKLIKRDS